MSWTDQEQPKAVESERALLGMILRDPDVFDQVADHIRTDDFYKPEHRQLFALLADMRTKGEEIDLVSVSDRISRAGVPTAFYGGLGYVADLPEVSPSTANPRTHVDPIVDTAQRRRVMNAALELADAVAERRKPTGELLDDFNIRLQQRTTSSWGAPMALAGRLRNPPPPQRWLVNWPDGRGCLPRSTVGILASDGGVGKTRMVMELACVLASGDAGVEWLAPTRPARGGGFPIPYDARGGRTLLLLAEEREEPIHRRLCDAAHDVGADIDLVEERVVVYPFGSKADLALTRTERETGRTVPTAQVGRLLEVVRRHGPFDLVVLDPLSAFASDDTETSASAATVLFALLAELNTDGGPTVLVCHHTTKASGRDGEPPSQHSIRGSSGIVNRARWAALVQRPPWSKALTDPTRFDVVKANDAPRGGRALREDREHRGRLYLDTEAEDLFKVAERERPKAEAKPNGRYGDLP